MNVTTYYFPASNERISVCATCYHAIWAEVEMVLVAGRHRGVCDPCAIREATAQGLAHGLAQRVIEQGWLDRARRTKREYGARTDDTTYTLTVPDLAWAEEEAGEPVDARDLQRRVQRLLLEALDDDMFHVPGRCPWWRTKHAK